MRGPDRRALPPGRRALLLCVPYLAFAGLLLGIEGLVRWTRPHVSSLDFFVTAPEQQAQLVDSRRVSIFEGDPLLFWRLKPNLKRALWDLTLVTTNPQGMRYDRPVGRKPPGTFRIVCLGDSVTFGYRVPRVFARRPTDYDPHWLPYPALMEQRLRAANPGRGVEVIPLAVPGYSSHQGLAWLRRDIAHLQPDVVTALFGWNDISRRSRTDAESMRTDWLSVAGRRLLSTSQAMIYAWRWLHGSGQAAGPGPSVMRVPREQYVSNLLEIARLARAHGAAAIVIGPVYRDRVAHPPEGDEVAAHRGALRTAMAGSGVAYLKIPELTEDRYPSNGDLFLEHIHPNHKGHRVIAEELLAFMASRGLLDGLSAGKPSRAPPPPGR